MPSDRSTFCTQDELAAWMIDRIAEEADISRDEVQLDRPFSDYGLDSLSRFILAGELVEKTGIDLSPTLMWECTCIRDVISMLSPSSTTANNESIEPSTQFVPLQPDGQKPPVICVAGIDLYSELARQFGPDRPVFGVYVPAEIHDQDDVLKGRPSRTLTVPNLAQRYASAIQTMASNQPCHIAGVSFGGILAFEIARQLRESETPVGEVLLLDSVLPRSVRRRLFRRSKHLFGRAISAGPVEAGRQLRKKLQLHCPAVERALRPLLPVELKSTTQEDRIVSTRLRYFWELAKQYEPEPCDGSVTLFRARDSELFGPGYEVDPSFGWQPFVRDGLEVRTVPGSHLGILESPHVAQLGAEIRESLQEFEDNRARRL